MTFARETNEIIKRDQTSSKLENHQSKEETPKMKFATRDLPRSAALGALLALAACISGKPAPSCRAADLPASAAVSVNSLFIN